MELNQDRHILVSKEEKNENTLTNLLMHRRNVVSQEQVKRYMLTHGKNKKEMKSAADETQNGEAQVDWMSLSKQRSWQEEVQNFELYLKQIENLHRECGIPFSDIRQLPTDDEDAFKQMVLYEIQDWAPIQELAQLGSSFDFYVTDFQNITVFIEIAAKQVIPEEKLCFDEQNQLKRCPYTTKEYMLLLKQYVLGLTIRIAREIYSFLPVLNIDMQVANAFSDLQKQENIWIQVRFTKQYFEEANFEKVTSEEFLQKFTCHYKFDTEQGFLPIKM